MRFADLLSPKVWATLAVCILVCACSSPDKPRPAELEASPARLGVSQVWSNALGVVSFPLSMRVVDGQLFAAGSDGTVVVINAATGQDIWRSKLSSELMAGVGTDGNNVAVVSRDNEVVLLNFGKEVWRQRIGASTLTAPLVAGGRVFTLAGDRTVLAFDVTSGRKLWQQQRSGDSLVLGQAGVIFAAGDTLVVGWGGRLVGLNPQNGNVRWDVPVARPR